MKESPIRSIIKHTDPALKAVWDPDDYDSHELADLRRRQADTGRVAHGAREFMHKPFQIIAFGHRVAHGFQRWIGGAWS